MGDSPSNGDTSKLDPTLSTTTNSNINNTINSILGGVQDEVNAGGSTYESPLYAGVSAPTQQSWADALSVATDPYFKAYLDTAQGNTYDVLAGGGLTDGMTQDVATTKSIADAYKGIADTAGDVTNSDAYQTLRTNAGNDALTNISAQFNNNGRFGGGSYAQSAGEGVTNAYAALDYQAMQDAINTQLAALAGQQGSTTQSFNMGQTGVTNAAAAQASLPDLYNSMLLQTNTEGAVGSAMDADAQAQLLANYDLWQREQDANKDNLSWASSVLQPTSGSSTTGATSEIPWYQSILGLGISAAGALL